MLTFKFKTFNELELNELYDLLQLRSEVFVVEQNCVYQDIDGKDQKAYHILGYKNNTLVAYTRLFKPGDYFTEASIGRVVVSKRERMHKYGYDIMNASIEFIRDHLNAKLIKLSAQTYLKRFYNNLGFKENGAEYLEDDIPHIAMLREFND
ncbi:MAG: GNAT family N-acetyltransferase [Winogradskyella sp.]|nr:GNAT family N-acetyltransferase [Winogradskyella sp.]MBT8376798.1 GNAT family N-acetyltransferase [Bacteroidia bacterium]NNC45114.1 GNAT family N-acetyltransferase [Winogradskyella sp.]NNF85280.1 GNAT family N-acetyltransferase [Winogradskyella sp.]NNK39461.1 GNAT family N-acetyltransferase [Winogradskyella sp.]